MLPLHVFGAELSSTPWSALLQVPLPEVLQT